jgi:type IV secretion system protein VirB1
MTAAAQSLAMAGRSEAIDPVGVALRTLRASAAFLWRWRTFFFAALAGLTAAFLGTRIADWMQPSRSEEAVDLSARLSRERRSLGELVRQCAPRVAPNTLLAIMHTESRFNPLALHVNGDLQLRYAPRSTAEAIGWSVWLIGHGYSVDMGLMQINSRNLARLRMSVADAFEPCRNIHAAAVILTEQYDLAAQVDENSARALLAAISAYNTGNFHEGFRNGYVSKVLTSSKALLSRYAGPAGAMQPGAR